MNTSFRPLFAALGLLTSALCVPLAAQVPRVTSQQTVTGKLLLPSKADPGTPTALELWISTTNANRAKYRSGGTTYSLATTADIGATVQAWDADLDALAALSSTGLVARTASNTWAQRTITGTTDKITVTDGNGVSGNPTLTIASTYAGQTSITTLGTIGTGTWQGTTVGVGYGGTGVTSLGTLSKTDDTNVTLTLGGTPSNSLIQSVNLTLGWTGQLAVSRGGTGAASLTSTAVLLGGGTSAINASDLTYSTPTLTVPSGFTISGASSQFTTASNKTVATYSPSTSGIADFSSGGVGWQITRPNNGAFVHAIFSYNTSSDTLNNLAISARHDMVFANGASPDTSTEKMRLKSTGNLLIGGTTDITGSGGLKLFGTTEATTGGAGSFITLGGIYSTKAIVTGSTTASTGTTSGALIVQGGGAFAGNVNIGGTFSINGYSAARPFNITADSSLVDFFAFSDTRTSFTRLWLWGPGTGTSHGVGFRDSTGSTTVLSLFDGAATNPYQVLAVSTTEATTGGAGSLATLGGFYAAKKIITASTITVIGGATFLTTSSALTDGAGANTATFTNSPVSGNPTKWIGINDNGTTRYIPAF